MVVKKKVLKELQKYNDDLDKHLPELNLDFLKNKDIFSSKENDNDIVPLLANNLMDVKTELALIRKNLVDGVEGMVLRVMSQQQENFSSQMNGIFTQMLVEMKGNFAGYISDILSEMGDIKNDLTQLKIVNSKLDSKFDGLDSKLIKFQSLIDEIKLREEKTRSELTNNFGKKLLEISDRNIELEDNLSKVMDSFSKSNQKEVVIKEVQIPVPVSTPSVRKVKKINLTSSDNVEKLVLIENRLKKLDSLK